MVSVSVTTTSTAGTNVLSVPLSLARVVSSVAGEGDQSGQGSNGFCLIKVLGYFSERLILVCCLDSGISTVIWIVIGCSSALVIIILIVLIIVLVRKRFFIIALSFYLSMNCN